MNNKMNDSYPLNRQQEIVNSKNCMKLLGFQIGTKLYFEKHISTLGKKASNQLNAISRIQKFDDDDDDDDDVDDFFYGIIGR